MNLDNGCPIDELTLRAFFQAQKITLEIFKKLREKGCVIAKDILEAWNSMEAHRATNR